MEVVMEEEAVAVSDVLEKETTVEVVIKVSSMIVGTRFVTICHHLQNMSNHSPVIALKRYQLLLNYTITLINKFSIKISNYSCNKL